MNKENEYYFINRSENWNITISPNKLEEIKEQIEKSEMPLSSYTLIHRDAILSDAEKHMVINWSEDLRKQMEAKYPKDSLVRKRGPEPSNEN